MRTSSSQLADSAALRDKGQALAATISSAGTDLSLNQAVYRALAAVPLPSNDPATRHYLERSLLEYRLSGVDKDDATRARIRQLQDKITALSLELWAQRCRWQIEHHGDQGRS